MLTDADVMQSLSHGTGNGKGARAWANKHASFIHPENLKCGGLFLFLA